jgi:hypothetical protein
MVFLTRSFQVDKKNGVYFYDSFQISDLVFTFTISSKTEAGSAGEQPARDKLMSSE